MINDMSLKEKCGYLLNILNSYEDEKSTLCIEVLDVDGQHNRIGAFTVKDIISLLKDKPIMVDDLV